MWVTGTGGSVLIYGVDPTTPQRSSAPAPATALSAPAPQAPESAAPQADPQPAAPEPAAPEPAAPEEPAEKPAEEPAAPAELDWQNDDTVDSAAVDNEPIEFELAHGIMKLRLPEQFWNGPRDVVLTGTRAGQAFTHTIRLTTGDDGRVAYELIDPATGEPVAEESEE
jgi:hypothetical protein